MLRLGLWAILVIGPAFARAGAPTPEIGEPYQWKILLRTAHHPLLDDAVRQRLAREFKASLQPGLGPLGAVEVIDVRTAKLTGPIENDFAVRGLAALEPTALRKLDSIKYHGVSVDVIDGAFVISTRQYDGFTGRLSPVIRTRRVATIGEIGRAAGLLIEPDFGTLATVETILNDSQHVTLLFKAHTLGPLDGKAKKGDIYAVVLVNDAKPSGHTSQPVAFTLLKQMEAVSNGRAKAQVLTRWANAFTSGSRQAVARRAMQLPTTNAPVTIRLVDGTGRPHTLGSRLTVTASDLDFTAKPGTSDGFEWRQQQYISLRPYQGVACISIGVGLDRPQLFPVPVLGTEPILLAFDIDPKAEARAEFIRECTTLRARTADLFNAHVANAAALDRLITATKNRDALDRANTGRDLLIAGEKVLRDELKTLLAAEGAADPAAQEILDRCDRLLVAVREGITQLDSTAQSLKDALAKSGSAETIEKDIRGKLLAERIAALRKRGDIPEAIDAYTQLIELFPANEEYKDDREKLKAEWAPKDDAHRQARDVIRLLMAAKSGDDFKDVNEKLNVAIPMLKSKKDKLGLIKLNNTFEAGYSALRELISSVEKNEQNPQRMQQSNQLDEIMDRFRQMEILARESLKELVAGK
jgi:tetratricopeptide (TPR) repeat protein